MMVQELITPLERLEVSRTPRQLMAKPALAVEEFFVDLLGIPASTMESVLREPDPPKIFLLGRRRYLLLDDALEWLEKRASRPYAPRKNNRQK
jgi:hypothetical protein